MAGLYIHIPFCHSKCAYCDFYSTPNRDKVDATIDAIIAESKARKAEIGEPFRTLYLGGGTPSILDISQLHRLLSMSVIGNQIEEATIEANPEDITLEKVKAWRELGINRISMGIQSFNDSELQAIGRRHTADDALKAVATLREGGISDISCDLIYGLPGQDLDSWKASFRELMSLNLPHFSSYCLSYEPGTRLYAQRQAGKVTEAGEELIAEMYEFLTAEAERCGYQHYEISNFCQPGCHSRHNSSYWDSTPYLGLGPSAHSFDGKVRRFNPSNLKTYLASCPAFEVDEESIYDNANDIIITQLRTSRGLSLDALPEQFRDEVAAAAKSHIAQGNLIMENGRLKIPENSWLVADAIMRDLLVID
jgi:oxygen-independent coproporphyrinogen-3 oxidase